MWLQESQNSTGSTEKGFLEKTSHGNHRAKTYNRYIKDREGTQTRALQKIINSQRKIVREEGMNAAATKQPENINKMGLVSTYLSIITPNVNGLNSPMKWNRVAEWIENKTQLYTAYKRFTSASRTHTGSR